MLALSVTAVVALAGAGHAVAASPQQIYKDLADNGRLDGKYSRGDIARAFNLERVVRTDQRRQPARRPTSVVAREQPGGDRDRRIPFSGLDLALFVVGGGPLLLIGVGLRRLAAPPRRAGVVEG